jgi:putative membrane protein
MWYWHGAGMGWGMLFSGLLWLVVLVAVIVLAVWGVRKLTERGESESKTDAKRDPLEITKERYAKGEISKEEFEQIKKDLS